MSEPMTDELIQHIFDMKAESINAPKLWAEVLRLRKALEKERLGIEIMADGAAEHDAEQQEEINRLCEENNYLKDPLRYCCDNQAKLRKVVEAAKRIHPQCIAIEQCIFCKALRDLDK